MAKDEPKGTPGTNPDGTPKDESNKGTPKDKGKLYTVAAIDKIKSDAAAMGQGRAEKAADQEKRTLTSELQSTKSRLDALEGEVRESRLAEARGDPAALQAFNREEALKRGERELASGQRDLARDGEQLKVDRAAVDADKGVVSIAYIAAKHGLKPEDLEELGISDPEALEKVAAKLATGKGKGEDADTQAYKVLKTDAEREAFLEAHPDFDKGATTYDSGDGAGQGELTEEQRLDQRFPTMKKP